jgi:hypothetical protein
MRGCKIKVLLINFDGKAKTQFLIPGLGFVTLRKHTSLFQNWQRESMFCSLSKGPVHEKKAFEVTQRY